MGLPVVTTADLDRLHQECPAAVFGALGQLTPYDRLLYFWSAREFYRNEGLIVDGGALVGGTTITLAEGLLANRHVDAPDGSIVVYDLFQDARDGYSAQLIRQWYGEPDNGEPVYDFEGHFRRNVAPYARLLEVRKGDIATVGLPDERPIEILSIDVAKSPDLMREVARRFFPRLVPGRSIILHQDYIFPFQPWLHIAMEMLGDLIDHVYDVPTNCTSMFAPRCPITAGDVEQRLGRRGEDYYRVENVRYLYRAAERAQTHMGKVLLTAAVAYFYLAMGRRDTACFVARRLIDQFDVSLPFVERSDLKTLFAQLGTDYRALYP